MKQEQEQEQRIACDYARFPREFASYRWFKLLLVALFAIDQRPVRRHRSCGLSDEGLEAVSGGWRDCEKCGCGLIGHWGQDPRGYEARNLSIRSL